MAGFKKFMMEEFGIDSGHGRQSKEQLFNGTTGFVLRGGNPDDEKKVKAEAEQKIRSIQKVYPEIKIVDWHIHAAEDPFGIIVLYLTFTIEGSEEKVADVLESLDATGEIYIDEM